MRRGLERVRRVQRIGRVLGAALVVVLVGVGGSAPAGAQTPPWGTYPAAGATSTGGLPDGVVVVGDSLVLGAGLATTADEIRTATGYGTYVNAAGGATWVTYSWPGQQNGNSLIWDYANFFDARLTIGALATNDARIMTQHPDVYTQSGQYGVMEHGVDLARDHSQCVMLVNVRRRSTVPGMSYASTVTVNDNMTWLAAVYPSGGVHVANWDAHSASHPEWFITGDVHLTSAGTVAYRAFLASEADRLIDEEGC